jgi:hypothetical protein
MRHVRMNDRVTDIFRALPSRLKSQWVFPSGTGETPLDANNFINGFSTLHLNGQISVISAGMI